MNVSSLISTANKNFLDIVFPIVCQECGTPNSWFCNSCQSKLIAYNTQFQSKEIASDLDDLIIASDYNRGASRHLLHLLKYQMVSEIAKDLGAFMARQWRVSLRVPADIILTVPLHNRRLRWRGFNQSDMLATEISRQLGITFAKNIVVRHKFTRPQVGLNLSRRQQNVKEVFRVSQVKAISNKNIILVDDVYTSGATMVACAQELKANGADKVYGLVLAKG